MPTVEDFKDFVTAVHHDPQSGVPVHGPFPWQRALLDRVLTTGTWPRVIDVPTGLGKTSVLDVAVFVAALRPDLARRRIFFVVDRRLVVDEAHEHALRIQRALQAERAGLVCQAVAQALRARGGDLEEALTVTRMRGGVTWDRTWLERPDQHAIITGTIDQIGSRLLFRGYGVSEHARSIDAALVGTDSLIVVDEAHLASEFTTTVDTALSLDHWPVTPRPVIVTMSATSPARATGAGQAPHGITAADVEHPVARQRLYAPKKLSLVGVTTTRKKADVEVPRVMADLAGDLATRGLVGVVANTVARARAVFSLLDGVHETILLTGRSRPIERDMLLARHYDRIKVGRDRDSKRPFIVVATQTIEVGANVDFDALVTESASLPALVQRLGRLNRLGGCATTAPAYVVHDSSVGEDDPVYGAARLAAWRWLAGHTQVGTPADPEPAGAGLDASPMELRALVASAPAAALDTPLPDVPVLETATLDAWARTSPTPHPDPPIAPFLHGIDRERAPVTVLWRAGLAPHETNRWATVVDFAPPVAEESIDLPVRVVKQWLYGRDIVQPVADIDLNTIGADDDLVPPSDSELSQTRRIGDERSQPQVLRYVRRGDADVIPAGQIQPGDTIVIPTSYGGCDAFGWHPASTTEVIDIADLAHRRARQADRRERQAGGRNRPLLRIGPHLRSLVGESAAAVLDDLLDFAAADLGASACDEYRDRLAALAEKLLPGDALHQPLESLLGRPHLAVTSTTQVDARTGDAWTPAFPVVLTADRSWHADDSSEAASSSSAYPGSRTRLDHHQREVADCAKRIASNLALPEQVVNSIWAAARWHDEGKRDIRFQAMLYAGHRATAELSARLGVEPLAKSGIDPTNRAEARRARDKAGYPAGMRHEALSARIAALRLAHHTEKVDPALVIHLVGSHHGCSRPLLPPVSDPAPVAITAPGLPALDSSQTVDWEAPARFGDFDRGYGRWGLALMEAVVRLADIWCSARNEVGCEPPSDEPAQTGPTVGVGHATKVARANHTIALPALDGRDALGFLASLGVLRLLNEEAGVAAQLSFSETDATALLHSPLATVDQVAQAIATVIKAIPPDGVIPGVPAAFPLAKTGTKGSDPMRIPRSQFRSTVRHLLGDHPTEKHRRWLHALVTDLAVDDKGQAALTPFTAPVGQQTLRSFFAKPLALIQDEPAVHIRDALTSWQRVDGYTGEYLDHRALRSAADHPTGRSVEAGVPSATWLALMALPLLRVTGTGATVQATLWHTVPGRRQPIMAWPLWRQPLGPAAAVALLEHPRLRPRSNGKGVIVNPTPWPPLGVFTIAAAARQPIDGRKSAGVLTPLGVEIATARTSGGT
ncbi:MAG TPA: type I-U CRISPR-associated helicase/endonuclease Cas3 [Micromonosporaceae bacterium]|nr:type I-U CRISPR-associated helicase/endonuclease Cas3 [Micromonosporaceae bacterium]